MDKEKKPIEIELRSDEFQEIVQQSPKWLIRSGIYLVLGFLILMLWGSWFFRYPDLIEAKMIFTISKTVNQQEMTESPAQTSDSLNNNPFVGQIILSLKDSHQVTKGQKVNIRLEDYPAREYGMLSGTVKNISSISEDTHVRIEVELPAKLTTNYNTTINLHQGMKGSAEIITENLRLIQRFIKPVKSLLK